MESRILGQKAEVFAARYLEKSGFRIIERNWRHGHKEIDIIALDQDVLVFVEVKARKNSMEWPEKKVSKQKQQTLIEAARAYSEKLNWQAEVRFDIIAIRFFDNPNATQETIHYKDAFFPGWH